MLCAHIWLLFLSALYFPTIYLAALGLCTPVLTLGIKNRSPFFTGIKMKLHQFTRHLLAASLLIGSGLGLHAQAAEKSWPEAQPLNLIVPFGPGSSPDYVARVVAEEASKELNQTIVVVNKPGASGNLGTAFIAKAPGDGYTFGVSITGPMVNNTVIYERLPYDPKKDLVPLTLAVHQPNVLITSASSGVDSIEKLVKQLQDKDQNLNFPSTGSGTVSHLSVELLLQRLKAEAVHVPYASSPAALTSVISGDTQFGALPPIAVMGMINDGRLNALAVTSAQRSASLPTIPTMAEVGYPGIEGSGWIGFVMPSSTPETIQEKLSSVLINVLHTEKVQNALRQQHMDPVGSTPAEFAQYMEEDYQRWEPLITELNIRAD